MSLDYCYLNHDKGQYFFCGLQDYSSRFSSLGSWLGSRALAILLSDRGTWGGNRISVVSDSSKEFEDVYLNGINIEIEVVLMLIEVDGLAWVEPELENLSCLFRTMCDLAIYMRGPDIIRMLDQKFGKRKWQQIYETKQKGTTNIWSQRIVDAQSRNLKLLTSVE